MQTSFVVKVFKFLVVGVCPFRLCQNPFPDCPSKC